jgi:hypothetical protein
MPCVPSLLSKRFLSPKVVSIYVKFERKIINYLQRLLSKDFIATNILLPPYQKNAIDFSKFGFTYILN